MLVCLVIVKYTIMTVLCIIIRSGRGALQHAVVFCWVWPWIRVHQQGSVEKQSRQRCYRQTGADEAWSQDTSIRMLRGCMPNKAKFSRSITVGILKHLGRLLDKDSTRKVVSRRLSSIVLWLDKQALKDQATPVPLIISIYNSPCL